jgi:hypothetical protein
LRRASDVGFLNRLELDDLLNRHRKLLNVLDLLDLVDGHRKLLDVLHLDDLLDVSLSETAPAGLCGFRQDRDTQNADDR